MFLGFGLNVNHVLVGPFTFCPEHCVLQYFLQSSVQLTISHRTHRMDILLEYQIDRASFVMVFPFFC